MAMSVRQLARVRGVVAALATGALATGLLLPSRAVSEERREVRERHVAGPKRVENRHWVFDGRHNHAHYYPAVGYQVAALPPGFVRVGFAGGPFFFSAGVWFRPLRQGFVVVRPPVGIVVPVLPPAYATLWIGGAPYYYANDVYYSAAPSGPGYVVVNPPPGAAEATAQPPPPPAPPPAAPSDLIVYPRGGQSSSQLLSDRAECSRWASSQTGFDPANPAAGEPQGQANYQRAEAACLEGRGYTVR
jgi:hypothetical protein